MVHMLTIVDEHRGGYVEELSSGECLDGDAGAIAHFILPLR